MASEGIKEESKHLCAVCLDTGIYTCTNLEVHHVTKLRDDTSLLLNSDNLICLCRYHHLMDDKGYIKKDYLYNLNKQKKLYKMHKYKLTVGLHINYILNDNFVVQKLYNLPGHLSRNFQRINNHCDLFFTQKL